MLYISYKTLFKKDILSDCLWLDFIKLGINRSKIVTGLCVHLVIFFLKHSHFLIIVRKFAIHLNHITFTSEEIRQRQLKIKLWPNKQINFRQYLLTGGLLKSNIKCFGSICLCKKCVIMKYMANLLKTNAYVYFITLYRNTYYQKNILKTHNSTIFLLTIFKIWCQDIFSQ